MSLQDDIARYEADYHARMPARAATGDVSKAMATGLQREKVIIDRDSLPRVELRGDTYFTVDGGMAVPIYGKSAEGFRAQARHDIAAAEHLEAEYTARESEAARLDARRDELAQELYFGAYSYDSAAPSLRTAINSILFERDRAAAAEAEVARMTKEAGR